MGELVEGEYAKATLRLSREVRLCLPSVLWNLMSKACGLLLTVAARLPAENVVPESVELIEASTVGFSSGKRSKCGPLLAAPCQCVVSTDKIPSETASISYISSEIWTISLTEHLLWSA